MWTLEVTLRTWIVHSLTRARPNQQLYQASPLTQRMPERISMRAGHKLLATNLHMYTKQKYFYYSPWRQTAPESKQIPENQNTHSQNASFCYPHYYSTPKLLHILQIKKSNKNIYPWKKIELLVLVLILILFFSVGWPVGPWRPVVHLKEIQKSRLMAWSWWRGIPMELGKTAMNLRSYSWWLGDVQGVFEHFPPIPASPPLLAQLWIYHWLLIFMHSVAI